MAIASEGETSYRGGAGGKFQKRPARRHQTTPYDRPPSIVRNPRPGGWVSKLFDPASRFISARAFKFFSNFRKRITEAEQEPKDGPQEVAPNLVDCNEVNERDIACNGNMNNSSEGNGILDLERMLQQKTFTRSEIDRLTELLHSRTTESSYRDKEKTSEGDLYKSVSDIEKHNLSTRSPLQDRDEGIKLQNVTATGVSSKVLEEDIASPAELAKAYMGRSSKVSPSMLGVRSQAFKEETPLLNHGVFPSKSSALSLVSKSVLRDGAPEKSFATPRSRGRSAIYKMARTPYSRGTGSKNYIYAGPSSSSSSPQSVWEHNGQLGSKQLALKRRSSVLDDDSGSVGAIRRIRQKPNLLYNTSPLSSRRTGLGHSAGQHHAYSSDKHLLLEDANNKVFKNREESEDDSVAGFRNPLVHSQSRQMASKILQQLEKITPQKSSESKQSTARDKSPIKLTSNMLRGQALRSLEKADSTKFLQKQECGRLEDSSNALQDAGGETSKKKNVVEENGFKESSSSLKLMPSSAGANATSSMKNAVPNIKNGDTIVSKFSAQPPQKKRAFRMTANEDFAELDDETYTNGFASGEKTEELQIVRKSVSPQATAVEKILTKAEGKIPENLTSSSTSVHKLSGGSVAAMENTGDKTPAVVAPTSIFQQDVNSQLTFSASPSGESAGPIPTSWSNSKRQTSNSFGNDAQLKIRESDKVDVKNTEKLEHVSSLSDNSTSAVVSASTASAFVSSTVPSENLNNGLVDSKPFSHSIPPKLPSSNSTEQVFGNSSTITHSLTSAAMTSSSTSISSPSIFAVKPPSFPIVPATPPPSFSSEPVASPVFSFGASKTESTPATTVSTVTGPSTVEMKSNEETPISNKPPSGGAFATTNAGNNPFGFSNSFSSSSSNNQSQVSLPSFGSSSTVSSQLLPTTGASTATQSVPFQFGSSGSSTIFGTSGSSFTTNVSVMGSSVPPANPFGSGTTSPSSTSFPFSSVSPTNPFGSSASSPSPSPLFSFGASQTASSTSSIPTVFGQSTGTSSVSTFSFTSPTVTTSPMPSLPQSKPVFGSTTALRSPGNSGDQMNMEDSMAEDPAHPSNPTVPVFGQSLVSSSNPTVPVFGQSSNPTVPVFGQSSNPAVPVFGQSPNPTVPTFGQPLVSQAPPAFNFGSAAPPSIAASPFQFGGQQNQATPQNLPSFPTSNSLVNSGGSFSLGSGGGDKGNRKMVRISKNKNRRK